jgi:dTMP kinase
MVGKLIVFEGVEGCGKTTQLQRLHQWLGTSGWAARLTQAGWGAIQITREPGGTPLGQDLRQLLLGQNNTSEPESSNATALLLNPIHDRTELLLYAADRAQHVEGYLRPALAAGSLVLCDRYTDSTVAYQGYGRGLDLTLIQTLNAIATQGLTSDLTLWLNLDAAVGLARATRRSPADRIEQADLAFHRRVQQGFATLAQNYPERIVAIDASATADTVAQQIQQVVAHKLQLWLDSAL